MGLQVKLGNTLWYDHMTIYRITMVWCAYSEKYDAARRVQERLIWFHLTSAFPSPGLLSACRKQIMKKKHQKTGVLWLAPAGWEGVGVTEWLMLRLPTLLRTHSGELQK